MKIYSDGSYFSPLFVNSNPVKVGGDIAIGRWQPDTVEPIAQATPTIYVDSAASGTGSGADWTNAYTTIMAAHAAAGTLAGAVVSVSGGASGKTYTEYLNITKGVTIQGSTETSHDGLVYVNGQLRTSNTSGTITLNNFKMSIENLAGFPFRFDAASVVVHNNMLYGIFSSNSDPSRIYGLTHTFNYCTFTRAGYDINSKDPRIFTNYTNASTFTFNYCTFDDAGYTFTLIAGSTWTYNNCDMMSNLTAAAFINIGNSALTTVNFNRCKLFGLQPVDSGASSVLNVDRCYWHKEAGISNVGGNSVYFDTANIATITNSLNGVVPKFTNAKNGVGQFFVRYDDLNELDVSTATAAILNPEIPITHAINLHGRISNTRPTASDIDDMRTLIADGNEIMNHGATHSNGSDMGVMNIYASSGTSPTIDIATTQAGDSTTWTGTLTITINAETAIYDLTDADYDTMGELIADLNGKYVGDGRLVCWKSLSTHSNNGFPCMLEDVTAQAIGSTYEANYDRTAYNTYEISESIEDLTYYINAATDRNSSNAVSGTSVAVPNPVYVCKGYASPYGEGDDTIVTLLQADANITHSTQAGADSNSSDYYGRGDDINLYENEYIQLVTETQSEDLFAMAAQAAASSRIWAGLYHGNTPSYNGSLANFKAMLIDLGVGDQTMAEYFTYIRTDGGWTITEPNAAFTGTVSDYLSQGDYSLQDGSPLYYKE